MCFENIPCKALHSGKKGFGMAHRRCEIDFKPQPLLQKTFLFYVSETLAMYVGVYLHTNALAHVCKLKHAYTCTFLRMRLRFQKHNKGKFSVIMAEV